MSSNRRSTRLNRCKRCQINYRLCFCEYLKPIAIKMPIQVIMHKCETQLTSNTVNLMKQVHAGCQVHLRGVRDQEIDYEKLLMKDKYTPLYLFPDEDAVGLTPEFLASLDKPVNLIVPDGTWSQAKKVKKRVPEFRDLQSVTTAAIEPSRYLLRTPPHLGMLSTFEAMTRAIAIVEGKEVERELDKLFDIMMERFVLSRSGHLTI